MGLFAQLTESLPLWGIMNVLEEEPRLTLEACNGSVSAFEALVIHYEPRIRRLIYNMTHDVHLTQDLCQETFLAAYRAMPKMDGAGLNFAPWLYRIALNQVRSEWRHRKLIVWLPFTSLRGTRESFEGSVEKPGEEYLVSPDVFEEGVMQRDLVRQVLNQMSDPAVVCLLLDAEGLSYREIALVVQDSLPAVRSRLNRARHQFQQIYTQLDQEGLL